MYIYDSGYNCNILFLLCRALGALVAYFIVGGVYLYKWQGARGLEVIPQYTFWKDLPFLIKVYHIKAILIKTDKLTHYNLLHIKLCIFTCIIIII